MFDECTVGPPAIVTIQGFLDLRPDKVLVAHLLSKFPPGTPDETWIPTVAKEKWVIVTADRGTRCKGPKLPLLCQQYQVTHVLLSKSIHHMGTAGKVLAFTNNITKLIEAYHDSPGSRYSITKGGQKDSYASICKKVF